MAKKKAKIIKGKGKRIDRNFEQKRKTDLLHEQTMDLNYRLLLVYDLQIVHKTICDCEATTLELLQEKKLNSADLTKDLEEALDDINHAEKTAELTLNNVTESESKTIKEALLLLPKIGLHIVHAYENFFYRGKEQKDATVLYKRWLRAANKAAQYLPALEDLYATLSLEAVIFNSKEFREITIRKFMEKYCVEHDTKSVNSWKTEIENKAKDIIQPSTIGGGGHANKYWEHHLFKAWPRLRIIVESLPKLKEHT